MHVERRLLHLGGIAVVAFSLTACAGGASPSPSLPSLPPPAASIPALPSEIASLLPSAMPSIALPSSLPSGLPSFNANPDLEALLPSQIGGVTLTKFSFDGAEFFGSGAQDTAEFQALLQELGKSPDDFSFAVAGGSNIAIAAFQIDGVNATSVVPAFIESAEKETPGTQVTDESRGGKSVKMLAAPGETSAYLYAKDDVIFYVQSETNTMALIDEALTKLP